jgi:predicted ATPase
MNTKIVDTRSDLYSLGVTFYEIITGQLPFNETSSLGLMHSHLAHSVAPLSHFSELKVPPMIDALVAKLLQKNPEDRYLSATSLLVDVDHIIQALEEGHDHASLEIGREDEVSRFRIAPEFVAREKELKHLCDLFDQVHETSESRVATVAGYSGVGKSRLVKEVFQILSHGNLFYAESKYDQFKPFAPFATFSTLFSDLLAQVFVETASNLSYWRSRLIDILGDELPQALCELCPDLDTLLTPAYVGSLPPLVPLSGLAAEKRFRRGISKLTQAFALKEKPLILFVDDIQWAPLADLQLFCELRSQNNLILLTAYRDNEVDASHVVNTVFIPQIQPDLQLSLGALPLSGTRHLVCKTLRRPLPQGDAQPAEPPEVEQFVLIIHAKTQGNAFFIGQILQNLYTAELLRYNFEMAAWTWDIQAIQSVDASEDVVGLVLKQVHELSSDCRGVLAVASCLGNASFRLDIMSTALAMPQSEIASSIFEAMQAGLVVANDERYKAAMLVSRDWPQEEGGESSNGKIGSVSYRFLHDRVQQACFDMVALDARPALHARIGLRLFATYKQDESMIFDICTQINHAKALVPEELRMEMAHFNICAATIAFKNTANEVAMSSLRAAETFFPDDPWAIQGDFVQNYYMLLEEVSTSLADYDAAKVAAEKVLAHATDDVVKVKVHGRLMKTALSAGRLQESLSRGIEGLRYAGFDLAPHFADGSDELVQSATAELWAAVPSSSADIAALRGMRVMADPLISAVSDILLDMLPTVSFTFIDAQLSDFSRFSFFAPQMSASSSLRESNSARTLVVILLQALTFMGLHRCCCLRSPRHSAITAKPCTTAIWPLLCLKIY